MGEEGAKEEGEEEVEEEDEKREKRKEGKGRGGCKLKIYTPAFSKVLVTKRLFH